MKENRTYFPIIFVIIVFLVIFTYLSMNLKSRNYGFEIEDLTISEGRLKSKIDKLLVEKERLLNLDRVERIVIDKLHYQFPTPEQLMKINIDEN